MLPLLDIGHLTPKEQQRRITNERVRIIRKLRGLLREAAVA